MCLYGKPWLHGKAVHLIYCATTKAMASWSELRRLTPT